MTESENVLLLPTMEEIIHIKKQFEHLYIASGITAKSDLILISIVDDDAIVIDDNEIQRSISMDHIAEYIKTQFFVGFSMS